MSSCLVADLGGMPMVDDSFKASAAATLACAVRQRLDEKRQPLAAYLQPELARECYRNGAKQPVPEMASIDPNSDELAMIERACEDIVVTVPQWKPYFSIPLRWRRLVIDMSSSSNPLIPQHIYLGERGINSHRLREHIVHEISHTWIGMIAEVAGLATHSEAINVLPSGTSGKNIGQVMYALTFAATAVRLYRGLMASGRHTAEDVERLIYLEHYADGCLNIAEPSGKLTPNGLFLTTACRQFLEKSGDNHGYR